MNKMKQKLLALAMSVIVMSICYMPVMAIESVHAHDEEIECCSNVVFDEDLVLRGEMCGKCGIGNFVGSSFESSRLPAGTADCIHGVAGAKDNLTRVTISTTYRCTYTPCGFTMGPSLNSYIEFSHP